MMAKASAPSARVESWNRINWKKVEAHVYQMQVRIAKSIRQGRWGKAKALQHLLSRSKCAKLLAVKKIISNKGSRTAGIDGVKWSSAKSRWEAAMNLAVCGYKAQPLRRIYIPKKNGKLRPLGIPTLHDRAMQMLFALGLKPIAETVSDKHSYGFREKRSLHDAVQMGFIVLGFKNSAQWILEADIKACFDRINHEWLLSNIPLPKVILRQWLKSGFMESGLLYNTDEGTPQGGIISPILCNMTLDGLESLVVPARKGTGQRRHIVRYADDFIITGATPEILQREVKPKVEQFLKDRGLELSEEKTKLSHIDRGFNFLGFSFRKYSGKLLIKPEDGKTRTLIVKVRKFMRGHHGIPFHVMLLKLNRIVRGWAYAYRKVVSKERMGYIDSQLYWLVRKWLQREHRSKTWAWIANKYYKMFNTRLEFCGVYPTKSGCKIVKLFRASDLPIRYHVKVRAEAIPYDPAYHEYFEARESRRRFDWLKDRMKMNSNPSPQQAL